MSKKKLDVNTKAKLIYSGELALFAILFLVLGILLVLHVIKVSDWKRWVIAILPLPGCAWAYATFIWTLVSPKKRKKTSLLDKALLLPSATAGAGLAIYLLAVGIQDAPETIVAPVLGGILLYFAVIYVVEALYHYKHPIPGLLDAMEEAEKEEKEEGAQRSADAKENDPIEEKTDPDSNKEA